MVEGMNLIPLYQEDVERYQAKVTKLKDRIKQLEEECDPYSLIAEERQKRKEQKQQLEEARYTTYRLENELERVRAEKEELSAQILRYQRRVRRMAKKQQSYKHRHFHSTKVIRSTTTIDGIVFPRFEDKPSTYTFEGIVFPRIEGVPPLTSDPASQLDTLVLGGK